MTTEHATAIYDTEHHKMRLEIATRGYLPVAERNLGCNNGGVILQDDAVVTYRRNADDNEARPLDIVEYSYSNQKITAEFIKEDAEFLRTRPDLDSNADIYSIRYTYTVVLPDGPPAEGTFQLKRPEEKTTSDTESQREKDSSPFPDTSTGTVSDTEPSTESSNGVDSQGDSASESETDTAANTDTELVREDTDSQTDTSAETSDRDTVLHIEAECACGLQRGDCNSSIYGSIPNDVVDTDLEKNVPLCNSLSKVVEYMNTNAMIVFHDIDFSPYNSVIIKAASANPNGRLRLVVGESLQNGHELATVPIYTGSWSNFALVAAHIEPFDGAARYFYIVGDGLVNSSGGNADIDWLELTPELIEGDTDVDDHQAENCLEFDDCYADCWTCAKEDYCYQHHINCAADTWCNVILKCIEQSCGPPDDTESRTRCLSDCVSKTPNGEALFEAYRQCVMCDVCPTQCATEIKCTKIQNSGQTVTNAEN
ncbi:MAG: hypothetical protein JXR76_32390 [Deltaproteobacteria bacterium]|nr:hypothetical protein [Deltaproteobacteria bacterium]